jgi:hypothetical protein
MLIPLLNTDQCAIVDDDGITGDLLHVIASWQLEVRFANNWTLHNGYRPGGRTRSGEIDPRWHAHVQIERDRYKEIRAHLLTLAAHRRVEALVLAFYRLPFEPYAPIRRQFLNLLRAVNRVRKTAGFELLPTVVLPLKRRIVRPFELPNTEVAIAESSRPTQCPIEPV